MSDLAGTLPVPQRSTARSSAPSRDRPAPAALWSALHESLLSVTTRRYAAPSYVICSLLPRDALSAIRFGRPCAACARKVAYQI
eukprot:1692119-Pleurochrysis_carterae.AAC.1